MRVRISENKIGKEEEEQDEDEDIKDIKDNKDRKDKEEQEEDNDNDVNDKEYKEDKDLLTKVLDLSMKFFWFVDKMFWISTRCSSQWVYSFQIWKLILILLPKFQPKNVWPKSLAC